ncbi:calcium-binding protein [Paracoccus aminophilus]|uniref:Serralysin n=1 Tax=Paracoccus aminophilus JCM 7686 TaxID=1367847 RepID=S5Y1Q5_PARAH|nr:calcium-binding protein [Paracoccus aminophilus]AGT09645.1 serralysin [Paracoccus aminophilus JCM 7686]
MPDIPNNTSTTALITGTGDFRSSLEVNGDSDWWATNLKAGLTYDFYLTGDGTGTNMNGLLTLRDALGGNLKAASVGNWISFTPQSDGRFYLDVADNNPYNSGNPAGGAEGPYVLRARMNDTVLNNTATTAKITASGTINGSLETTNDSDWYRVELKAGQRVGFSVTPNGSANIAADVVIHDQYGNVINTAGPGPGQQATTTINQTGVYYIEVRDNNPYDGAASGNFSLISRISDTVWNNNTTTSRLIDGGQLTSAIDAYYDSDWHRFDVVAGRSYTFTMTGTGGTDSLASMELYLRDQGGSSISYRLGYTSSGGAVITWTADRTGTVFLDADYHDYSSHIGRYNLSVISNSPTITGTSASETLNGGENDNLMRGGAGNDTVFGNGGNDRLYGEVGDDVLNGGAGNDTLYGDAGNDTLIGGAGVDTADYSGSVAVRVNLATTSAQNTGYGLDVLSGIENVVGGDKNDVLTGDNGANLLSGGLGNDTLNGGAGNDTLDGGAGNDMLIGGAGIDTVLFSGKAAITVDLNVTRAQNTGQGLDTIQQVENVISGDGNDRLTGDAGANMLSGGAGNDTLSGGAGNDVLNGGLGNDLLDGGAGADTIIFTSNRSIRVDLGLATAQNTGEGLDTIRNIENATGGSGNDRLTGNGGANVLSGGAGNDMLIGNGGNDKLIGGDGNDTLVGGLGKDVLTGGAGHDVFVFDAKSGADRITDFTRYDDTIQVKWAGHSYADLDIRQVGGNTVVHFAGTTITVVGTSYLTSSDFHFV